MAGMREPAVAARSVPAAGAMVGGGGAAVARQRPNARALALLALGHLVVDTSQGALPALLPFLKSAYGLSYAAAGVVLLVANVTSSIVQPVFGYLSDRAARRWLLPWALVLASGGLALVGLAPAYLALLGLVVVAGLGVAAYHPEGYKTANLVAGDRKATGLSLFSIGGNAGIALGPPVITGLVTTFGLPGTLGMAVPGLVAAALVAAALPGLVPAGPAPAARTSRVGPGEEMRGAMALLIAVVTVRSWTQLGLVAYVPFLYVDVLGADPRVVGPLLFAFLGAGAVGTLIGGPIADRWGTRRYITGSFLVTGPLLAGFLAWPGTWLAAACLTLAGFALVSSFSVTVALGQAYLPRRLGMAAGLIVGLAIGTGGVGVALLGWLADHWGLWTTLRLVAGLPLAGLALACLLPEPRR
jgi:FSR family fosmidomycin resistance protein-like MFS transporter